MTEKKGRRRDPRYPLRRGQARIEFTATRAARGPLRGIVAEMSVAGLAFELESQDYVPEVGFLLGDATIRVGHCVLRGEVAVRDVCRRGGSGLTVGGLFYPDSPECEDRLMSLISGLSATA